MFSQIQSIFVTILLLPCFLQAQDLEVSSITTADGLSQGMIFTIKKDTDGFIWVGTKNGLNRYDGYDFKVFTNDPFDSLSISGDVIRNISEGSKGRYWILTESNGLNYFDKEKELFYSVKTDSDDINAIIDNNDISYTKEVLNGDLWINSPKGLIRFVISDFEKELQTGFSAKLYPNSRQIRFDKDGTIWAMSQHDIVYWDRDQEDFIPIPQMFSKNDQPAAKKRIVTSSQESGIWVLEKQNNQYTFHRIKEAGAEIETFYLKNTDLYKKNKNRSTSLRFFFFIPALQEYWINFQFDPTFYALDFNSSTQDLSARPVFSLKEKEYPTTYCFVDEETLWIGTSGYGIRKVSLKPKKFRHLMPNKSVMNISSLGEEGMLTRVYSDIYFLPNPADTFFLSDHHNKLPNGLKQVLKTQDNSYWGDMKKHGSFIKLNKNFEKEKEYLIPSKYSPHKLFEKDAIGNLWISSLIYDLLHLDHKTDSISVFDCQKFDDSAESNRAQCLYLDTQNNLWKGQRKGLKKITLDEKGQVIDCQFFQNIPTDRTSLRNNSVSSCLDDPIDPNTYLWVGTRGGGLNKLNKKTGKFEHFTTEDGLSNNVVQGILADEENKLWLSTNNGLSQFDPIQKTFKNYNATDGLQDDQFNTFSYAKNEKTGEMFFGGINGITAFFPKDLKTDKAISNTYITQLKINNEPVNVGKPLKNNKPNPLQKAMYLTEEMDLTWEQNQLSFKFASIDFHDSYKCIYKYKLSPIDKDWVNADESRLANYANLAVGSYVFEVKGTNSDGVWNETPARLEIRIHPPWWRTWWAYGAYFLLIAFTVFKIYQFQVNKKHLQNQLLFEQKEAERLADLDKMKTNFFTNITHEFRTPLTLVIEPLRQVLEQPQKDWKDKVLLAKNNSQKLLGLINQLLDLSKLEHKKMGVNLTHGNILELVEAIVLSFQPIAKKQGILLQYRHPETLPNSDFDKDKIEKTLRNLLHNALKFTPKEGTVALTITLENQATPQLVLSVSDTGIGISKENQKYIFDRFYQVDASTTRKGEGTGIGLALTKELVELLGGTITLESVEGKGSTFKILVPFLAKETSKTMAAISQTPSLVSNEIKILDAATISTKTPLTASQHKLDATNVALVIEDNEELRTFIKMSIEANYQVLEAKNGKEGTEMALEHIPNIIISDIMMPEMDGFEVCQHLKTDLKTSHIPIILLTGKTAFESRIQGLKYGADAYMNKPFHTTELLVRMEKLIELRQHLQIKFSQQFFAKAATDSSPKPSETKSPHEHSELEEQFLNELRSYILAQYHDPNLSVDDIAQEVRMSRAQLYRKLGALINQTPSKLIKEIRLQAAMNLLKTKKGNVTEIAEMVGFSSQKYFSTQFKEKYGISPKKVG